MPLRLPRPRPKPRQPRPPFPDLAAALAGARRVAVVGVGSDLRGDDVAGVLVARRLRAWAARTGSERLAAFVGGAAPENFTGEIARFAPELVVLVDAAHLGKGPGAVEIVPADRIGGLAFSTHMLPAPILLDYLRRTLGCRTLVLGIDIAQKEVLARVSPPVERAVRRVVAAFRRALAADARCACCGSAAPSGELTACRGCGRPACSRCIGFYGQFMLMCEDCRLAAW